MLIKTHSLNYKSLKFALDNPLYPLHYCRILLFASFNINLNCL